MSLGGSPEQPQAGRALCEILAAVGAAAAPTATNVATLRNFLRQTSQRAAAYENLELVGIDCASRGEYSQAIEAYSGAISASPFWAAPHIHWRRGDSYAALGRYEEAIVDYEVSHNDDVCIQDELRRRWRLVALLQESQQPERVIHTLHELVDYCTSRVEFGGEWRYFYERALARAGLKEFSEALDDCQFALDAPGAHPGTINELRAAILAEIPL